MDTKAQNIPITRTQPHSNSQSQRHTSHPCRCSQGCSWSRSQRHHRSWSSSQSPAGHGSRPRRQSQGPRRSSSLPKRWKRTMHSRHCPKRSATHSCRCPKNKRNLEEKNRKVVRRSRRAYRTKRRSSGRRYY